MEEKGKISKLVFFFLVDSVVEILVSYSFLNQKHVFFFSWILLFCLFCVFFFFLQSFFYPALSVCHTCGRVTLSWYVKSFKHGRTNYQTESSLVVASLKKRFQLIYLRWNGEAPVNLRQPQRPTNGDAPVNLRQPTSPLAAAGDVSRTCSRRGLGGGVGMVGRKGRVGGSENRTRKGGIGGEKERGKMNDNQ